MTPSIQDIDKGSACHREHYANHSYSSSHSPIFFLPFFTENLTETIRTISLAIIWVKNGVSKSADTCPTVLADTHLLKLA